MDVHQPKAHDVSVTCLFDIVRPFVTAISPQKKNLKFEGLSGHQATYSIKTNLKTLVLLLLQKCEENICQIKKQIFQIS